MRTQQVTSILFASALAILAGCGRQDMVDQHRYEPLEASPFFEDGRSVRPPVEGTVARGHLRLDEPFYTGKRDGELVSELPVPVTEALLSRGRERFDIYCSPCHGRTGAGQGMVVRRGFRQPPSLHIARLRRAAPGYFFDVITNGFGVMSSYATLVPVGDRWAITAYIMALQYSQNAPIDELPPADAERLQRVKR